MFEACNSDSSMPRGCFTTTVPFALKFARDSFGWGPGGIGYLDVRASKQFGAAVDVDTPRRYTPIVATVAELADGAAAAAALASKPGRTIVRCYDIGLDQFNHVVRQENPDSAVEEVTAEMIAGMVAEGPGCLRVIGQGWYGVVVYLGMALCEHEDDDMQQKAGQGAACSCCSLPTAAGGAGAVPAAHERACESCRSRLAEPEQHQCDSSAGAAAGHVSARLTASSNSRPHCDRHHHAGQMHGVPLLTFTGLPAEVASLPHNPPSEAYRHVIKCGLVEAGLSEAEAEGYLAARVKPRDQDSAATEGLT